MSQIGIFISRTKKRTREIQAVNLTSPIFFKIHAVHPTSEVLRSSVRRA